MKLSVNPIASAAWNGLVTGWAILTSISIATSFREIMGGSDVPLYRAIVWAGCGGLMTGAAITAFFAHVFHRRTLRLVEGVGDEIMGKLKTARKRVEPLRKRTQRAFELFMECLQTGRYDEAERAAAECKRLNELIDVVADEQLGIDIDDDDDKKEDTHAND